MKNIPVENELIMFLFPLKFLSLAYNILFFFNLIPHLVALSSQTMKTVCFAVQKLQNVK